MARGRHLFPFRTEQLSPSAPMVLGPQGPGRVGRRRFLCGTGRLGGRPVRRCRRRRRCCRGGLFVVMGAGAGLAGERHDRRRARGCGAAGVMCRGIRPSAWFLRVNSSCAGAGRACAVESGASRRRGARLGRPWRARRREASGGVGVDAWLGEPGRACAGNPSVCGGSDARLRRRPDARPAVRAADRDTAALLRGLVG